MTKHLRHRPRVKAGLTLAGAVLMAGVLGAQSSFADSKVSHGMGFGGMGPQGMNHQGMGPQGMGDAEHQGMFTMHELQMAHARRAPQHGRQGWRQPLQGNEVTVASVTEFLEARVKRMDNPRLKVGEVTAKDDKVIQGDIVTVDNSLVWRFEFDRQSGRMQHVK